jgi:hypothetical protein
MMERMIMLAVGGCQSVKYTALSSRANPLEDNMRFLRFTLLVTIVSIGLSSSANGQIQFGVAAGVNWSTLGDVDFESVTAAYESQQGWHAGAFIDFRLLILGIRPGFYYVNSGPLLSGGLQGEVPTPLSDLTSFDVTYISVPVDIKLGLPLPVVHPYVFLGPEFKFSSVPDGSGEIADQLESTVIAGNIGLGVGLTLGKIKLFPEVRLAFDISGMFGDTITIGNEEIQADTHAASGVVARLGIGM